MTSRRSERASERARKTVVALDKLILGFSRRWAAVVALLVGIYAGLPFVAPLAMYAGVDGVGKAIYTIYGPMCHQWAFRSWFLFGDAAAYPRERAGLAGPTFESYASQEPYFQENVRDINALNGDLSLAAKAFAGSERMGWKVALCQRDIGIYVTLALFSLAFAVVTGAGLKVPYLPFWAYLLIAIAPMGLDGFSQLFANPPFNGFGLSFYPIRESTPLLRTFTGALFGLGNGWLAFPYIEDSMRETRELVEKKLAAAGVITLPGAPEAELQATSAD